MNDLIGYSIGVIVLLAVTGGLAWAVANLFLREAEACPHCGAEPDTTVIDATGREHDICGDCADAFWPDANVITQERAS